jgi:hypothetical protein
MIMKRLNHVALLLMGMAVIACNNDKEQKSTDTKVVVDTVKVIDTVKNPAKTNPPAADNSPKPPVIKPEQPKKVEPPAKPVQQWRDKLREYHELLCLEHTGKATVDSRIRQVELAKELKDVPKTLSSDEKFYFTTEMARAVNMESCK